jgi:hypothetical protein
MTASPENRASIGPHIEPPGASLPPDLQHLEPIIYGDIFDYPLTRDEIWRYCPLPLTREELDGRLDRDGLAGGSDGLHHLPGRDRLVPLRRRRRELSRVIWKKARRVAGMVQYVPFIRGLAVTGSLATNNADADGDPDFLVITAKNRVWTVFFFLGTIQRLTSVETLCPNFYISEAHLKITPCDYYNAREVTQAIPLTGGEIHRRFREANNWVYGYLPNHREAEPAAVEPLPRHRLLRMVGGLFERIFAGRLGDGLERFFRRLLFHRLPTHYQTFGGEAPAEVLEAAREGRELRFHGLHHRTMIRQAIAERIDRLNDLLTRQRLTG